MNIINLKVYHLFTILSYLGFVSMVVSDGLQRWENKDDTKKMEGGGQ